MSGAPSKRFRVSPDALAARVGDEVVLVHTRTDQIYVLNRTGARVWELLGDECGPAEIERRLVEEFEVIPAEVSEQVEDLIASLAKAELIAVSGHD